MSPTHGPHGFHGFWGGVIRAGGLTTRDTAGLVLWLFLTPWSDIHMSYYRVHSRALTFVQLGVRTRNCGGKSESTTKNKSAAAISQIWEVKMKRASSRSLHVGHCHLPVTNCMRPGIPKSVIFRGQGEGASGNIADTTQCFSLLKAFGKCLFHP